MSKVRGKDTSSELIVRKALHNAGFRFRLHAKDLPGNPDIILPKFQTVIFVNGCLWHGHECAKFRWPVSNSDYWRTKITKTQIRDSKNIAELECDGWKVDLIWDCDSGNGIESLIQRLSNIRRNNVQQPSEED
jgi:DNA mismatch endonuclease (patch repair protein)